MQQVLDGRVKPVYLEIGVEYGLVFPAYYRRLEKNSQRWLDVIDRNLPAFLHRLARDNAGVPGSRPYHGLQSGDHYRMYCFAKA